MSITKGTPLFSLTVGQFEDFLNQKFNEIPSLIKPEVLKEEPRMSVAEACKFLECCETSLHSYKKKGIIPFHRLGAKVFFYKSELQEASDKINSK